MQSLRKKHEKEEIVTSIREFEVSSQILEIANHSYSLSDFDDKIADLLLKILSAGSISIWIYNKSKEVLSLSTRKPAGLVNEYLDKINKRKTLEYDVIRRKKPLLIRDLEGDNKIRANELNLKSMLLIPLLVDDSPYGVITFLSPKKTTFNKNTVNLLTNIARVISVTRLKIQAMEEMREDLRWASTISSLIKGLSLNLKFNEVCSFFYTQLKEFLNNDEIYIYIDEGNGNFRFIPVKDTEKKGQVTAIATSDIPFLDRLKEGNIEVITESRKNLLGKIFNRSEIDLKKIKSIVFFPILFDGKIYGFLNIYSKGIIEFTNREKTFLTVSATYIALAIENKRLFNLVEESHKEWERTFDSISDPIAVIGSDHRIRRVNKAFAMATNLSFNEIIHKPCQLIMKILDSSFDCLKNMEGITNNGFNNCKEGHMSLNNGSYWLAKCTTILGEEGNCQGYIFFAKDITELRKNQEKLHQMARFEAIGSLSAGIAHDYNNLLGGILTYASGIKSRLTTDSPIYTTLCLIESAAKRGSNLSRDILSLASDRPAELIPLNLNEVIRDAISTLERILERSIEIKLDLLEREIIVEIDVSQFHEVVTNLCINARDAMLGGGTLRIGVALHEKDDNEKEMVEIFFSDTGIGVEPEILPKIFDPFFTTKPKGKGTGLGLAMVQRIIVGFGGYISAESIRGQGTTFHIFLPKSSKKAVKLKKEEATHYEKKGDGSTILVVDDEEIIRSAIYTILSGCGFSVLQAESGEIALAIYKENYTEISLVILDMLMPGMNGLEVYDALMVINPDVSVLIATGYADKNLLEKVNNTKIKGLLYKPFTASEIVEMVIKTTSKKMTL